MESGRIAALTAGLIAGLTLVLALWLVIQPVEAKKPPKPQALDTASALQFRIAWWAVEGISDPHVMFKHECCSCGLTHTVLIVVRPTGLEMYWWTDREATRRARAIKGLPDGSPEYGAEYRSPPQ